MKRIPLFFVAALLFACSQKPQFNQVTITNTADYEVTEKPFIIKRTQLEEQMGTLGENEIVLLSADGGTVFIPSQLDDTNGDGKWDELFSMVDLRGGESKTFGLYKKDKVNAPMFQTRTNIHFADINNASSLFTTAERLKNRDTETTQKYFQFEGPGWENDVVGFRNYFDARNGMDIWGKTTKEMVLAGVGLTGGPSYHEMQPWGMDILKVGNSLGAGAIALETDTGLYRIGPDGIGTYQLVALGPLRSTFDLRFENIELNGRKITINHRICIIAGKPWYKNIATIEGATGMNFVTGIVNLQTEWVYFSHTDKYSYMFTHDNQAFDGEKLGMAIIVPQNNINVLTAPEEGAGITQTYYTTLPVSREPITWFFMAGWEKQHARWAEKESFERGVNEQGRLISAKLNITFTK